MTPPTLALEIAAYRRLLPRLCLLALLGCSPAPSETEPAAVEHARAVVAAVAWTADADEISATFGASADSAGDVNGDGYADVIVGSPRFDGLWTNSGQAFLFLGSASGLSLAPAWTASGGQANQAFGESVSGAGDVNGDGYADVIIGAPSYGNGQGNEGAAFVYLGSASGLASSPAWLMESNLVNCRFGRWVTGAGDVNGDGYSDVLVAGSPGGLYLGSPGGPALTPVWSPSATIVAGVGDLNGDGRSDVATVLSGTEVFGGTDTGSGVVTPAAWGWYPTSAIRQLVAGVGDVNGDGYGDLMLGDPEHVNANGDSSGRALLFYGSAAWPLLSPSLDIRGTGAFGNAVASAGDVNGDGFADVVIGATEETNGNTYEGRAHVHLGSATGLKTTAVWIGESNQNDSDFGAVVASAGDVNGDGMSDVLVTAPNFDDPEASEGKAFLFQGAIAGVAAAPTWTGAGGQAGALYGHSVASAGDVNGDGYADVIIGAPYYDNPETSEGRALLYLGSATGVTSQAAWSIEADQATAQLGYSVAGAGDVNGDGYTDVIVGARVYDNTEMDEGRALVYLGSASGLGTSAVWTAEPNQPDAWFGHSVASAGDVNGDGYADVIVGVPRFDDTLTDEGQARVYLGSASGLASTPAWRGAGGVLGAQFGFSVASAGDVNGDGYSDVVVGAPLYDGVALDEGQAHVYLGSAAGLATAAVWSSTGGGVQNREFGTAVASAGDVNADGYSDIVIGGPGTGTGRAYLYLGSPSGPSSSGTTFGAGSSFGASVATAGDVNGDGFGDVFVGAPDLPPTQTGGVSLFLGSAAGLATTAAWTRNGATTYRRVGASVASAGDVNGDGLSDLLYSAPARNTDGAQGGQALVHLAGTGDATTAGTRPLLQALRPGTNTPVCPLTSPGGNAFDARAFVRSPAGRDRLRLVVEVKRRGVAFDGTGLVTTPYTDTGLAGTILVEQVAALAVPRDYHYRVRIGHAPWLTWGAEGSRWRYGGTLGEPLSVHLRTRCGAGDRDSDGVPDCSDGCPDDASKSAPGPCGCGTPETDSDSDGEPDCTDACPNDPDKVVAGQCGCGVPDADADADGTPDCNDGCPDDYTKLVPGACGCGMSDADTDRDGTENCNDGCPSDPDKIVPGNCGCGQPEGSVCVDDCPADPTKTAPGVCGCGTADTDTDSDGTPDCNDACPSAPAKTMPGVCGCSIPDINRDGDALADCEDACPAAAAPTPDGCPDGGGGGAGGEAGAGSGGENTTGGSAGRGATGGSPSGGSGEGGEAGGEGEAGLGGEAGSSGGLGGAGRRSDDSDSDDPSGCGCRVARPSSPFGVLAVVGLLLALVRRRSSRSCVGRP